MKMRRILSLAKMRLRSEIAMLETVKEKDFLLPQQRDCYAKQLRRRKKELEELQNFKFSDEKKAIPEHYSPGSRWVSLHSLGKDVITDEYFATIVECDADPDLNGEGNISVVYDDGSSLFTKVRKFVLDHVPVI